MPEDEEKCPTCEEKLKDTLSNIACNNLPPDKMEECKRAVDEYLKKDNIDPDEFITYLKEKGLWSE